MPPVTICIPAYRAERFLGKAVESVLAQSHTDLHVLISVDPAGDGTEARARDFAARDARVRVNINPDRLGWAGNVNACLDRVETPYFAFCMHDDQLHPDFVTRLLTLLEADPDAICANGGVSREGDWHGDAPVQANIDITGTPYDRVQMRLEHMTPSYSLKDLQRSDLVHAGLRLPMHLPLHYQADFAFVLANALAGNFRSDPDVLYFKSYDETTVTGGFRALPPETLMPAEVAIRAHMIRQIQESGMTPDEIARLRGRSEMS